MNKFIIKNFKNEDVTRSEFLNNLTSFKKEEIKSITDDQHYIFHHDSEVDDLINDSSNIIILYDTHSRLKAQVVFNKFEVVEINILQDEISFINSDTILFNQLSLLIFLRLYYQVFKLI